MFSSQGISSQGSILASIPFTKFSHTTNSLEAVKFTWNHIGRSDLDFVVHKSRIALGDGSHGSQTIMKVTAGADILEEQNLDSLVHCLQGYNASKVSECPVQLVVKSPFMAMRYPKDTHTVRRIQLKFRSDADFTVALDCLTSVGLHVTQSPPVKSTIQLNRANAVNLPANLPIAVQQPASYLNTGKVDRLIHPSDVISLNSSSSQLAITDRPYSLDSSVPGRSSVPLMSTHRSSEHIIRPNTVDSHSISHNHSLSPLNQSKPPFSDFTEQSSIDGRDQLFRERLRGDQQFLNSNITGTSHTLDSGINFQSQSLPPQMPTQLSDLPHASAGASVLAAPGDFVRSKFTSVSNKNCVNSLYHPSSSIPHESNRPTSTPVYSTDNTSLAVPPRRTLPFARPHTAAPKMTSESHQNTAPPPHARTNLTVQEENSPLAAKALTSVPNSALSGLKSKETTTRKRNSTPANGRQPASKRPKMISQSTQTQAISGHSHAAGLGHACSNEMTENGDANHLGVSPVFAGYLQRLFTIVNKQDTTLSPKEIWEIPRYTDGDDEVREMILNDFICANLEDKDFQKLCEDIEHAWRRVGLAAANTRLMPSP